MEESAIEITEKREEKRQVPLSAILLMQHVYFERYATAGIASVMVLFLNSKLEFDKDTSTAIYHSYEFFAFAFPIVGSIIADSWWGQFKTLFWMSILLAFGCIIIAVGTIDVLNLPITTFTIIGLVIITIGSGCIKPCSNAYGGDQYESYQLKSIALYFSLQYFAYNCGSITSRFVNPIFREDISCFGNDDCYVLAFGLPGVFIAIAAIIILIGKRISVCRKPIGSTLMDVTGCIKYAITEKIKYRKKMSSKNHWLDYAKEKYDLKLVMETKVILNVLSIFPPLCFFWALFDQLWSRWVFQATRMNGDIGIFTIKPDQISVVNPIMVLILIPLFEYLLFPLLSKIRINTCLRKTTLGGILAGCAFIISAILETQIDKHSNLHMMWMLPQYFVMTVAEILFTLPMLEFCQNEAPDSMKSILHAFRYLTISIGSLIIAIIAGTKLIESQANEFLLFAGLMFVDMVIFGLLASKYKRVEMNDVDNISVDKELLCT